MDRRVHGVRQALVVNTRTSIAERIRAVCAHLPADEFDRLVERMAQIEIKYAARSVEMGVLVDSRFK